MVKLSPGRSKTWPAPAARACVSLLLLLPALSVAQTNLPDLTHRLTPLTPRPAAPEFALKDLDGKLQRLSAYKGKVVLVNFWATWCPPCRREMPSMERLYLRLKTEPFQILAVNQNENFDLVFVFTGQLDPSPTFPLLLDEKSTVPKQWRVQGLPTSFIVDKQGRTAYRAVGGREFDHPDLEALIRKLIHE